jgi:hypothetical protein
MTGLELEVGDLLLKFVGPRIRSIPKDIQGNEMLLPAVILRAGERGGGARFVDTHLNKDCLISDTDEFDVLRDGFTAEEKLSYPRRLKYGI